MGYHMLCYITLDKDTFQTKRKIRLRLDFSIVCNFFHKYNEVRDELEEKKSNLPLMFMMFMCLFSGAAKKFPPVLQYIGDMWLHALALSLLNLSILLERQSYKRLCG